MRSSRIEIAVLPGRQGLVSNDDRKIELDEQSQEELPISELLPRLALDTDRVLRFAVSELTNWKVETLDDIDARNNTVSL